MSDEPLTPPYPRPVPGSTVRPLRVYGAGTYGESLYGRWTGAYLLTQPCTPSWVAQPLCVPAVIQGVV
jgi:hypothetical protein